MRKHSHCVVDTVFVHGLFILREHAGLHNRLSQLLSCLVVLEESKQILIGLYLVSLFYLPSLALTDFPVEESTATIYRISSMNVNQFQPAISPLKYLQNNSFILNWVERTCGVEE